MQEQPSFGGWATKLSNQHDLLHGLMPVKIAGISQMLEDRSPALRHHRTQYNNRLHGADIRINVSARSTKDGAIAAAQDAENYYYAVFNDCMRSVNPDAERTNIDQATSYGCGIAHDDFAPDIKQRLFEKRRQIRDVDELRAALGKMEIEGNPLVAEAPALTATFWEPDRSSFCEVGEKALSQVLNAAELEDIPDEKVRDWITSFTMPENQVDWSRKVKTYHLETGGPEGYIYDVVEHITDSSDSTGFLLESRPNILDRPWYSLMAGHENSEISVAEKYEPLIGPLYEVVQRANITGTLLFSGALQTGRNTLQLVRDNARGAEDFMSWHNMPANERPVLHAVTDAAVQNPPPGFHYEAFPVPPQDQVIEAHRLNLELIDRWGFPSALATDMPLQATASSAALANRQMESASDYLEPALRNRAKAWRERFLRHADAIQALDVPVKMPVYLRAQGQSKRTLEVITAKPEAFREQEIEVTFEAVPATVKYAMRESDTRLLELKMMSPQTFMARQYEDPNEEQKKIDLAEVRAPMKQAALQDAMAVFQENRQVWKEQAATEAGVPLPPTASPAGGPGPGEIIRKERPPGGASEQGLGTPAVIPEQPEVAGGMPPPQGTEIVAGAP